MSILRYGLAKAGQPLMVRVKCTPKVMSILRNGLALSGACQFSLLPCQGRTAIDGTRALHVQGHVRFTSVMGTQGHVRFILWPSKGRQTLFSQHVTRENWHVRCVLWPDQGRPALDGPNATRV